MIEYTDLIGKPFAYGGRGPDVYDCWGVVMECERRQTGRQMPDFRSPSVVAEIAGLMAHHAGRFTCFAQRRDEDIPFAEMQPGRVLMLKVQGLACHVGYIHRPRHFLHAWEDSSGIAGERISLWRKRIIGVYGYD